MNSQMCIKQRLVAYNKINAMSIAYRELFIHVWGVSSNTVLPTYIVLGREIG